MKERHDLWQPGEWDVLKALVNKPVWIDEACALIPNRTEAAISAKMSALRREAGIVPKGIGPSAMSTRDAVRERARVSSEMLRERLAEVEA